MPLILIGLGLVLGWGIYHTGRRTTPRAMLDSPDPGQPQQQPQQNPYATAAPPAVAGGAVAGGGPATTPTVPTPAGAGDPHSAVIGYTPQGVPLFPDPASAGPGTPVTPVVGPDGPVVHGGIQETFGPGGYTGEFTAGGGFEEVGGVYLNNPYSMGAIEAYGSPQQAAAAMGINLADWKPGSGYDPIQGGYAGYVGPITPGGAPVNVGSHYIGPTGGGAPASQKTGV